MIALIRLLARLKDDEFALILSMRAIARVYRRIAGATPSR
jgi:hypothetical protein